MLVDGSVWAWGGNGYGRLGDGTTTHRLSPVRIEGYGADTAMRLPPGGASHALTMFVVMADDVGQLGNGESGSDRHPHSADVLTASAIPELGGGIVQIARGGSHTLVLKGE